LGTSQARCGEPGIIGGAVGRSSYAVGPEESETPQELGGSKAKRRSKSAISLSKGSSKCVIVRGKSDAAVISSRLHTKSKLRTNQYRVVKKQPLGTGWQSKVYLVEDTQTEGRPRYAMKVIETRKLNKITKKATDSNLWTPRRDEKGKTTGNGKDWVEVACGKKLRGCNNVVPLREVIESDEELCMILELQERVLKKKRDMTPFAINEAKRCIQGLMLGVKFMHNKGIVHRDLKVENILIGYDGVVRISDFGMAHVTGEGKYKNDTLVLGIGSRKYRAPELFKPGCYSGFAADVWSIGIILYCLVAGYLPFEGKEKKEQAYNIQNRQLTFPPSMQQQPQLVDLLTSLLQKDPQKRINLDQAMRHPWLFS